MVIAGMAHPIGRMCSFSIFFQLRKFWCACIARMAGGCFLSVLAAIGGVANIVRTNVNFVRTNVIIVSSVNNVNTDSTFLKQ